MNLGWRGSLGAKATGDSNSRELCVEPTTENMEPWEDTLKISRADRKQRGDKRMRSTREEKNTGVLENNFSVLWSDSGYQIAKATFRPRLLLPMVNLYSF